MTDDQWLRKWRKWQAASSAVRARFLRMQLKAQEKQPLPF